MKTSIKNHQCRLATRPLGLPKPSDWSYVAEPVPAPREGEFLVKVLYISLDPAMRVWMNPGASYIEPVDVGAVMRAFGVGRVLSSRNQHFTEGDYVSGTFGVQEYALSNGDGVYKVDPQAVPLSVYLGVLGVTGLTAYFGLLEIGQPKPGETIVVSGAAGAVGSVVGQIAKIRGCRVVGIAGGPAKCRTLVDELGFDASIDYKSENVKMALRQYCPAGVNVYFDNVGGDVLDAVMARLTLRSRIVICGAISQYNNVGPGKGLVNYGMLVVKRARMEGFIVFDYADRFGEAIGEMKRWMTAGRLKSREDVVEGLQTFPNALLRLFNGENVGKLVLRIADN